MSKDYIRLDAFELGQIMGAIELNRLSPALRFKLNRATAKVYLDSGFSRKQVFGDQRYRNNRTLASSVKESPNV